MAARDDAPPRPSRLLIDRRGTSRPSTLLLLFWLAGSLLLAFIVLPLIGLGATQTGKSLARVARMTDVQQAIFLSVEASLITVGIAALVGVPLAYVMARARGPGKALLGAIVDLPLTVPHTVAGIALLIVFGRDGMLGEPANALLGVRFWGTLAGIVAAMLFVSVPYAVNAARIGFEDIDPRLEQVARTLGLGPWRSFFAVTLPLARRAILTGLTLSFARSISEFGAVAIIAYYPMTAPVRVYEMFLRFGLEDAAGAAVLLLLVSLVLFMLFRYLAYGRGTAGRR
jgi:molybdate/tungstate transport system permease protein